MRLDRAWFAHSSLCKGKSRQRQKNISADKVIDSRTKWAGGVFFIWYLRDTVFYRPRKCQKLDEPSRTRSQPQHGVQKQCLTFLHEPAIVASFRNSAQANARARIAAIFTTWILQRWRSFYRLSLLLIFSLRIWNSTISIVKSHLRCPIVPWRLITWEKGTGHFICSYNWRGSVGKRSNQNLWQSLNSNSTSSIRM